LNQRPGAIDPSRLRSTDSAPPANAASSSSANVAASLKRSSSASAFFVSPAGELVTNYHVVQSCKQIRIVDGAELKLLAFDAKDDLALLVGPGLGRHVLFRASDRVVQGEEILAYGFPLQTLLASSGQIGAGLVAATSGLRNNPAQLQIDVSLQPGNSGGPLLDRNGELVGIVVSKLNAQRVARLTGDMPQNVNFAVKHSVVRKFLEQNQVRPRNGQNRSRIEARVIADEARQYTLPIECLN
jgi:serine protease Do